MVCWCSKLTLETSSLIAWLINSGFSTSLYAKLATTHCLPDTAFSLRYSGTEYPSLHPRFFRRWPELNQPHSTASPATGWFGCGLQWASQVPSVRCIVSGSHFNIGNASHRGAIKDGSSMVRACSLASHLRATQ